jgi:hypothetical protein
MGMGLALVKVEKCRLVGVGRHDGCRRGERRAMLELDGKELDQISGSGDGGVGGRGSWHD